MKIGIGINAKTIQETIALAERAEQLGYHAAWMTTGGGGDPMPALAAAATKTSRIHLGTSVIQSYPRHPAVLAQEAWVLHQLAPGRFRLGIGPSHKPLMDSLGLPFVAPLAHLEEYVAILREGFAKGKVDFRGKHVSATVNFPGTASFPLMIGALRRQAFELAGRISDGAITWLCPAPFVKTVGIPSMRRGAEAAGRPVPPLIAHAAVCVTDGTDEMREALRAAVRTQVMNIRLPYYQNMLKDAGYPEALEGRWSDRLIDEVIVWGSAERVARRLREFVDAGAAELLLKPLSLAGDPAGSVERTLSELAPLNRR